jgi:hypothetical protein
LNKEALSMVSRTDEWSEQRSSRFVIKL